MVVSCPAWMFFEGFQFSDHEEERHPNYLIYVKEGSITLFMVKTPVCAIRTEYTESLPRMCRRGYQRSFLLAP